MILIYSYDSSFDEIICHVWIIDIKDFYTFFHNKQGPLTLSVLRLGHEVEGLVILEKVNDSWVRGQVKGARCFLFFL